MRVSNIKMAYNIAPKLQLSLEYSENQILTYLSYKYANNILGSISGLELAAGIKDMLISNGFTSLDSITKMRPAELASLLGIDMYVARLIHISAKRQSEIEKIQRQIN